MNEHNNHERLLALFDQMGPGGLREIPISEFDLTLAQIGLMANVARHPGDHIQDLAERMELTAPTVSVAVRKLEESGWLRREEDEHDKRASCIFLTEKANKAVRKMMQQRRKKIGEFLAGLSTEEQNTLINLLQKAFKYMEDGNNE